MKQLAQARFEGASLRHVCAAATSAWPPRLRGELTVSAGHEKTFAVYKQEIQSLKDKIEVLESRPYNVPDELPARPEDAARIEKLEADLKQSQVERSKLKRGYTDAVSRAKAAEESSAQTAERVDELEQANTQLQQALADERRTGTQQHAARTQELETEMRTLRQELDAEVEHSKSLQAKIKTAAVPAALLPPNTASTSAASSQTRTADASLERARAELEDIKCRMGLLEDLSGLAINAMKREPDGTATFNCMMTDCFAEIGSAFLGSISCATADRTAPRSVHVQDSVPAERHAAVRARRGPHSRRADCSALACRTALVLPVPGRTRLGLVPQPLQRRQPPHTGRKVTPHSFASFSDPFIHHVRSCNARRPVITQSRRGGTRSPYGQHSGVWREGRCQKRTK